MCSSSQQIAPSLGVLFVRTDQWVSEGGLKWDGTNGTANLIQQILLPKERRTRFNGKPQRLPHVTFWQGCLLWIELCCTFLDKFMHLKDEDLFGKFIPCLMKYGFCYSFSELCTMKIITIIIQALNHYHQWLRFNCMTSFSWSLHIF